jgi:hypothetical protein
MVHNQVANMITTKYQLETDKFLFKADYDDELNIIYNHYEDKETKEKFVTNNTGEFNGRVKFDKNTIDTYISQAIGAAFPILVEPIGFVFTYDDLEARKQYIGEEKFNAIVAQYPKLIKRINQLGLHTQIIYRVETLHNFDTGEQTSKVIFDNTEENWWSSQDTPSYLTSEVFTPEEQEKFDQTLSNLVYLNPIERYIWNVINMIPKID